MPTGYTEAVATGHVADFPSFVLRCARAFGALIEMRDEPLDAPLPSQFSPDTTFDDERIAAMEERLRWLRSLDEAGVKSAAESAYWEAKEQRKRRSKEKAEQRQRYQNMLAQAEAWTPPTPDHVELRQFMIQQLEESIRFDCGEVVYPELPTPDPAEWLREESAKAERDLASAQQSRREVIERTEKRNEWLQALRSSLPAN